MGKETIEITADKIFEYVDQQKGDEIIALLSECGQPTGIITLAMVLATSIITVCDNKELSQNTLLELTRLMTELINLVHLYKEKNPNFGEILESAKLN